MTENIFTLLTQQVRGALAALVPDLPPEALARVQVEPPRDAAHGDMATNAALVAAKPARMPPPKLAAALAERLLALPMVTEASPAGPGFVNLRLDEDFLRAQLPAVLRAGEAYGDSGIGGGVRANVEYVSANPTGPMHVGHCRGAVVGDALANLLAKAGWAVTKEYYINDAGNQVIALGWAAYWRYVRTVTMGADAWNAEAAERRFGVALQYRGDYLVAVGEALAERFGDTMMPREVGAADLRPEQTISAFGPALERGWLVHTSWIDTCRETAVAMMMVEIREDLTLLGVEQEVFRSERALVEAGAVEGAVKLLEEKGLLYEGVLEPPKGKTPDDWEPRPQTLFRATEFGDDVDRPLRKSDGTNTYFANDIAYHADKVARGQDLLVDVWGADHGGYVSRMQAAVRAVSDGRVPLEIVLCQIVHVMKAGEPVRMSKRAGTYITLRDLIEEVGRDAVRFTMLTRKADAQMEFDIDKVIEQSRDNPVFYVQYAHARCRSVLRQAEATDPALVAGLDAAALDALADPAEMALIRRIAAWPRSVEAAATAREPHRIAFYLQDLAGDFHVLWNRGRDDSTLRFIRAEDIGATRARLALVAATATVIRSGLRVMGVTPVEEMR
jgi:arginyl-tRNA synthetase